MKHLLEFDLASLSQWLADREYPAYRARQIQQWLFQNRVAEFDEMSNLPKPLRAELGRAFQIWALRIATARQASDGTEKLLLEHADAGRIECVLLRDRERRSI